MTDDQADPQGIDLDRFERLDAMYNGLDHRLDKLEAVLNTVATEVGKLIDQISASPHEEYRDMSMDLSSRAQVMREENRPTRQWWLAIECLEDASRKLWSAYGWLVSDER